MDEHDGQTAVYEGRGVGIVGAHTEQHNSRFENGGDILLSTKGFELNSSYSITIEMKKKGV